jgi:hypothetical protein
VIRASYLFRVLSVPRPSSGPDYTRRQCAVQSSCTGACHANMGCSYLLVARNALDFWLSSLVTQLSVPGRLLLVPRRRR